MRDRRKARGVIATTASIVASILIVLVLFDICRSNTISAAFHGWPLWVLWSLILVGIIAYYGYLGYARHAYREMKLLSPIALLLGAAGTVAGMKGYVEAGGALIFLAYIIEMIVGRKLYYDYREESEAGAVLFILGVTLFVVSLPLALVRVKLVILGIIGDIVKLEGLILVLAALLRRRTGERLA